MKIRCSSLGKIMTSPRTKGEVLSQTAKTYIKELVIEETLGIKKEFSSRYTDKGEHSGRHRHRNGFACPWFAFRTKKRTIL